MREKIEPALTPEEWAAIKAQGVDWSGYNLTRKQLAALALDGQPFGFTREHLEGIRHLVEYREGKKGFIRADHLLSALEAAALIEALLPPEGA